MGRRRQVVQGASKRAGVSMAGQARSAMKFTYYKEDDMWIGWLEDYPDYRSQGESLSELKENLKDICRELTSGNIPAVRRVGELVLK